MNIASADARRSNMQENLTWTRLGTGFLYHMQLMVVIVENSDISTLCWFVIGSKDLEQEVSWDIKDQKAT